MLSAATDAPVMQPCAAVDFELEMVGSGGLRTLPYDWVVGWGF